MYKSFFLMILCATSCIATPNTRIKALNAEVNQWIQNNQDIFKAEIEDYKSPLYKVFHYICKDRAVKHMDNNDTDNFLTCLEAVDFNTCDRFYTHSTSQVRECHKAFQALKKYSVTPDGEPTEEIIHLFSILSKIPQETVDVMLDIGDTHTEKRYQKLKTTGKNSQEFKALRNFFEPNDIKKQPRETLKTLQNFFASLSFPQIYSQAKQQNHYETKLGPHQSKREICQERKKQYSKGIWERVKKFFGCSMEST